MGRISIEVSEDQRQQIKAMAALRGLTLRDYMLQMSLPQSEERDLTDEMAALEELKAMLKPRLEAVKRGEYSTKTVEEITEEVLSKYE